MFSFYDKLFKELSHLTFYKGFHTYISSKPHDNLERRSVLFYRERKLRLRGKVTHSFTAGSRKKSEKEIRLFGRCSVKRMSLNQVPPEVH